MFNKNSLLVVVDMQYDFIDMPGGDSRLPIPNSYDTIKNVNDLLHSATPEFVKGILFTQDWHDENHVEYQPDGTPFPKHCVAGTFGACVVTNPRAVNPNIPVYILKKNVFDMFGEENTVNYVDPDENGFIGGETPYEREEWIKDFTDNNKIEEVIIIGVATDICVNFAVKGFLDRGYKVKVVKDACKGLFREVEQVNIEDWDSKVELI